MVRDSVDSPVSLEMVASLGGITAVIIDVINDVMIAVIIDVMIAVIIDAMIAASSSLMLETWW